MAGSTVVGKRKRVCGNNESSFPPFSLPAAHASGSHLLSSCFCQVNIHRTIAEASCTGTELLSTGSLTEHGVAKRARGNMPSDGKGSWDSPRGPTSPNGEGDIGDRWSKRKWGPVGPTNSVGEGASEEDEMEMSAKRCRGADENSKPSAVSLPFLCEAPSQNFKAETKALRLERKHTRLEQKHTRLERKHSRKHTRLERKQSRLQRSHARL
eukprot:TRINITY_DN15625_c0_g1_i1.p1 TRINITY_DN15625_c0_g1~~TRINITY_DN15625_c0_g1_i1.p1  ORF type:complete len:211 (-),score=12.07 TRINITY_DN15625_c0_g1_i1:197-829(-)